MLRMRERVFLKEEHTTSYLIPNVGLESIHTSNFMQTNQVAVRNVTYMHVTTMEKKMP